MISAIATLLNNPIGRALLVGAAAFLALWWAVDTAADRREEKVRAEIERLNREKADAAAKGARTVSDCHDAGGRWVQSTGRCILPGLPGP